ncbi:MAG: hypothetical protein ABI797_07830 [Chloroflexota bacterium]
MTTAVGVGATVGGAVGAIVGVVGAAETVGAAVGAPVEVGAGDEDVSGTADWQAAASTMTNPTLT